MESTTLREQFIVQLKPVRKEYGVHVTSHTVCYSTNHFILRTKKKHGVYIINRTVYHLINVLIMDTEKEYGVHNTKSTILPFNQRLNSGHEERKNTGFATLRARFTVLRKKNTGSTSLIARFIT